MAPINERNVSKTSQDADPGTTDNKQSRAAAPLKRTRTGTHEPIMVQDDIWGTPLPQGLLRWFGFDYERAELPGEPLLPRREPPRWVGNPPIFRWETTIADARVTVTAEGLEAEDEDEDENTCATPSLYRVKIQAHGLEQDEDFTCQDWNKAQERCRQLENRIEETHTDRHAGCLDQEGELTGEACSHCERGIAGG